MKIENFISHQLEIKDKKIVKILNTKTKKNQNTFLKPLTEKSFKLYIIKANKKFLYVGITKQSLSNRLRSGFNAEGDTGYHGYKWKNIKKVDLFVWVFPNYTQNQIESIEAELVYLIRNKTNNWPIFQNEIHFNNTFRDGKKIAENIFKLIDNK